MRRISNEMDDYLKQLSKELTSATGRPVNITDASRVLAAHRPNIALVKKKRREILIGGSIINL